MLFEHLKFLGNNLFKRLEKPKSSLGYPYPTSRDDPLHSSASWLRGKQADDGAEGLWRLNDDLYDFSSFMKMHPGGSDWLELTKGTDITEAFEVHHISTVPQKLLENYFIRKAEKPRISPFTFEEKGFYKTLKRRARKELENISTHSKGQSKVFADIFLFTFIIASLIAVKEYSYTAALVSAIFLTMTAIAAHNFFHQKDNFRMYYFDFTMMSSRDWRVSHALSHHIYTNTVLDVEVAAVEPFFQYLPTKKTFFVRYISWLYSPILYILIYFGNSMGAIAQAIIDKKPLRRERLIPMLHLLVMHKWGGQSFLSSLLLYILIQGVSSFFFGLVSLSAGHHHPDCFHDGDDSRTYPKIDWGIHQMDSVIDKTEVTGSHFLVLISFGDHALHHIFPTLDHGTLNYLYPVLEEVCHEFGIKVNFRSQLNLFCGQLRQLAKIEPKRIIQE